MKLTTTKVGDTYIAECNNDGSPFQVEVKPDSATLITLYTKTEGEYKEFDSQVTDKLNDAYQNGGIAHTIKVVCGVPCEVWVNGNGVSNL